MSALTAKHVIFSRIEYAYSPNRRSGYQVFYATPSLSQSDVDFIEKRVQCFQAPHINSIRYQYFVLGSGNVAITHSKSLTPDMPKYQEVIDGAGREGAFIAHVLVLSRNQFEQLQNNPFIVIDNVDFIQTIDELLNHQDNPEEGIAIYADAVKPSLPAPSVWTSEHIKTLYELSLARVKDQTLLLKGATEDTLQIIRHAVLLANLQKRAMLTFDTVADHCSPPKQVYWAVGSSSSLKRAYFVDIDVQNPQLSSLITSPSESDIYDNWIRGVVKKNSTIAPQVLKSIPHVQAISIAFDNRQALPKSADNELLESIIRHNYELIQKHLSDALSDLVSLNIRQSLAKDFIDDKLDHNKISISIQQLMNIAAQSQVESPYIVTQSIYEWLIIKQGILKGSMQQLANIGKKYGNIELQALALLTSQSHPFGQITKLVGQLIGAADQREQQLSNLFNELNQQGRLTSFLDEIDPILDKSTMQQLNNLAKNDSLHPDVHKLITTFQKGQ